MQSQIVLLAENLAVASLMVIATVMIHFFGILRLQALMRRVHDGLQSHTERMRQALMLLLAVFGVFFLHTLETWLYAVCYRTLGEIDTFEAALYFSTVSFASLGYGDIVLSEKWRLLSAIEAANGLILFGWSTAFLIAVTGRLRIIEEN